MNNISICPFCNPEIEKIAFLKSENFLVIYNHAPILPGHSLVIPIEHTESILDFTPELRSEMMEISCKGIKMLMKVFSAKAFDWTIQEGSEAGQSVLHTHLHLIPRKENDLPDPGDWYPKLNQLSQSERIDSSDRFKLPFSELTRIADYIKNNGNF